MAKIFGSQYLELGHKIEFYLPTRTMNHDLIEDAHLAALRTRIASQLATMFGGCTGTSAVGFYQNAHLAAMQTEDVEILISYAKDVTRIQAHELIKLAEEIKRELTQESVMFVYDSKAIFV